MEANNYIKNRGSALLTALLLMTLMAMVSSAMMIRIQYDMYRTKTLINHDQLILATDSTIFWALQRIIQLPLLNLVDAQGAVAHIPTQLIKSYPDVILEGDLYDLQARFNINNMQNREYWFFFVRILQKFVPKIETKTAYYILKATINWVTPYKVGSGADIFTQFYASQKPPYSPGYGLMKSISEFRLVAGVNQAIFNSLLPYVTVLPTITPVNVNTAPVDLIMSLATNPSPENKQRFIDEHAQKGVFKKTDIPELENKYHFPAALITTESEYYLLVVNAKKDDVKLQTYIVLRKIGAKGLVISKTYGTL